VVQALPLIKVLFLTNKNLKEINNLIEIISASIIIKKLF